MLFTWTLEHRNCPLLVLVCSGQSIMVTDYLDAYKWLKRSTPEGSRVLSWWDYGYQVRREGERLATRPEGKGVGHLVRGEGEEGRERAQGRSGEGKETGGRGGREGVRRGESLLAAQSARCFACLACPHRFINAKPPAHKSLASAAMLRWLTAAPPPPRNGNALPD